MKPIDSQDDVGHHKSTHPAKRWRGSRVVKRAARRLRCPSCGKHDIDEVSPFGSAWEWCFLGFMVLIEVLSWSSRSGGTSSSYYGYPWYSHRQQYTHRCKSCGTAWTASGV